MNATELIQTASPLVMGILNVTPDSFSDPGRYFDSEQAIQRAEQMIVEGADIIDVGGESTRPGAAPVSADEQIRRTRPVITAIREKHPSFPISIDTQWSSVARAAITAGADIINDISALRTDPEMVHFAAETRVPVILMHMQGTPRTMQANPRYDDVVNEIWQFLAERIEFAMHHGIARERIIIDPGIGFGKTVEHNLQILAGLRRFTKLAPVLIGTSRKSFIGKILGLDDPQERLTGTIVSQTIALLAGVRILRAHDVKEAKQTVQLVKSFLSAQANRSFDR